MVNIQVPFTTTGANQDILQASTVQTAISQSLGMTVAEYQNLFTANAVTGEKQGLRMFFEILFSADNTVIINDLPAYGLIEQTAYSSGNYSKITSIVAGSAGSGTLIIKMY